LKLNKFFLCVCILVAGCSKEESNKTPVARLDNRTLALEEIRANIDTTRELSQSQIQQYIQRWLTEETLYREAVELGLDRTDALNIKVEDVRRQLAINALLEQQIYSLELPESTQNVRTYYEEHLKEFNLRESVALVSYMLFKNRDAATEFRNMVLKGNTWNTAVNQLSSSILLRVDSMYQSEASFLSPELWRVASNASIKELSYPVNTDKGYYILIVWKFLKQGQPADLQLVEKEIRDRLTIEHRRKIYNQLIQKLRAKHAIEVFVNTTPDSTVSATNN